MSKRSDDKQKQENRRFAGNVTLGILLVGTFVALIAVANRYGEAEVLGNVSVVGATVLEKKELVEHLELSDSGRVKHLDLAALEARLLEHPFVKGATVWDGGEGELVLEIEERSPAAVVVLDGRPVYLDDRATPLPFRFGSASSDVPVIAGVAIDTGQAPFDSAMAFEAIELIETIEAIDPELCRMIGTVIAEPNREYRLLLTERGIPVRIGDAHGVIPRMRKLRIFVDRVIMPKGGASVRSIDLRWRGQIVVEHRQVASEQAEPEGDDEA